MTARAFLVRGLAAGLLAGLVTFLVAFTVGEPHVQAAIDVEESHAASSDATHHHEDDGTVVSRHDQRTWGLLTGSLGVGTALGGLAGLVSAGMVGRVGRLSPRQSTAVVALVGWVAVSLVPFLKYPASPPAVGDPDTIGARTTEYFVFLLVSVFAATATAVLGSRVHRTSGPYAAVLVAAGTYLAMVVVVGSLMPAAERAGSFPADTLWSFRLASLLTAAALWATLGVVLTGFVGRLHDQERAVAARRELAVSL